MKRITLLLFILLSLSVNSQNSAVLNLANDDNYASFSFFDSLPLKNYSLFFTGENHRYPSSNSDLELKMFKYLHKNVGVRVFMVEFGQAMGLLIDRYIYDGDTVTKEILKTHSKKAYFNLFKSLRAFNKSLPIEDKFVVQSVDIERELLFSVKLLEFLLPAKLDRASDSIKIHIDAIKAVSEYYDAEREIELKKTSFADDIWHKEKEDISPHASINLLITNFETNKDKYRAFLNENYAAFSQAINWIKEYNHWRSLSSTAQQYLYRETYMENNVKAMFSKTPNLKAYGQFGRCHTQLEREKEECRYYYFNALATRLNNSKHPQLKDKVFSCPIFYPNATSFNEDMRINDGLKTLVEKTEKNKIMVFALDTVAIPHLKSMASRFNAVIINNLRRDKSENDVLDNTPSAKLRRDNHRRNRLIFLGEAGVKGYHFSEVNTALGTTFNNLQQFIGFSISVAKKGDFNNSTSFHWFPSVQKKINDSTTSTLSGFTVGTRFGKDVLKKEHYDLSLSIGYGFERWTNTIEERFDDEQRKDIFGNNRVSRYRNPAFIMDAGFNFRIHINWITFGFFGRYQLDFSNRKWRLHNELQPNTPNFSLNAYTLGVSLGANLNY